MTAQWISQRKPDSSKNIYTFVQASTRQEKSSSQLKYHNFHLL